MIAKIRNNPRLRIYLRDRIEDDIPPNPVIKKSY